MPRLSENERIDEVNEKISLIQKKDGLTFGTDAFLLAAFIRPQKRALAVELGTGTGIISLLLAAKERFEKIWALEVQEEFATLAARNVLLNRMETRVLVRHADLREFGVEEIDREVDVVFSNPPYMRTDSGKRNESDGKYIARRTASQIRRSLLLCVSSRSAFGIDGSSAEASFRAEADGLRSRGQRK